MTPHIIHGPWPAPRAQLTKVPLPVDRATQSKRRWHGVAEDGMSFGFDLETPLTDGTVFFETDSTQYLLAQKPESVLKIALGNLVESAQTAWGLGNLHFPIEVAHDTIRVADDPAARLFLERQHIHFHAVTEVFRPIKSAPHHHSHGHAH